MEDSLCLFSSLVLLLFLWDIPTLEKVEAIFLSFLLTIHQ